MVKLIVSFFIMVFISLSCTSDKRTDELPNSGEKERLVNESEVPTLSLQSNPGSEVKGPILVNPDFTTENLSLEPIKYIRKILKLVNYSKNSDEIDKPHQKGESMIWNSSYILFAMDKFSNKVWGKYSLYRDWSVESYSLAEYEFPFVLVGVSMAQLFDCDRILKINMIDGQIVGYFKLPDNLAGVYILHSLGESRYFAVSYQGDDSWRFSLLNLGDKPKVEKAIILRDLGLPSARGYYAFNKDDLKFYFNNRGLFISLDVNNLEVLKVKDMIDLPVKQITFIPGKNELCALSKKQITLLNPDTFEVLKEYGIPMQPAVMDDIRGKEGKIYAKKGSLVHISPSGATYRPPTNELVVAFDYSPKLLLINCETSESHFLDFTKESISMGEPLYFDESHLFIGGKYMFDFTNGTTKKISGGESGMLISSWVNF